MLKTTANKSFRSKAWLCTVWCDRCHTQRNPCMTYLCVNQATNSQKRNVPIVMSEQSAMVDSVVIADGIGLRVPGIDGQKYGLLHA